MPIPWINTSHVLGRGPCRKGSAVSTVIHSIGALTGASGAPLDGAWGSVEPASPLNPHSQALDGLRKLSGGASILSPGELDTGDQLPPGDYTTGAYFFSSHRTIENIRPRNRSCLAATPCLIRNLASSIRLTCRISSLSTRTTNEKTDRSHFCANVGKLLQYMISSSRQNHSS
jgi:hypothetical protein